MMKKWPLLFLALFVTLQGCINSAMDDDEGRPKTLPRNLTAAEESLIASGNQFSYRLFKNVVARETGGNVFISPLSVSMALGMTLNGAGGTTREGIQQTLGMSEMELQQINRSYRSLIELLVELDPSVEMNIGNSLWSRKGFTVREAFRDSLQTYFDARVDSLDFSDPAAKDIINEWVREQTNGRIDTIIDGPIPDDLVLYLINTIYFKGDWLYQFDPAETRPADFHLADGSTAEVEMMSQKLPLAMYMSEEVRMAELAYGDSLYKMTILMPANEGVSLKKFVAETLSAASLRQWTDQLSEGSISVELNLPKFESSYKKALDEILIAMGMDEAFSEGEANFSNINSEVRLVISEVMHKANITVDEEGSEAAAATSVGFGITSARPAFIVNRPFVYMIRERISGTILFMGTMQNPAESGS